MISVCSQGYLHLYYMQVFWMWMMNSIYHSVSLYFLTLLMLENGNELPNGQVGGYLYVGNCVFTVSMTVLCLIYCLLSTVSQILCLHYRSASLCNSCCIMIVNRAHLYYSCCVFTVDITEQHVVSGMGVILSYCYTDKADNSINLML